MLIAGTSGSGATFFAHTIRSSLSAMKKYAEMIVTMVLTSQVGILFATFPAAVTVGSLRFPIILPMD